jgi:hypothetical protein
MMKLRNRNKCSRAAIQLWVVPYYSSMQCLLRSLLSSSTLYDSLNGHPLSAL